MERVTLKRFIQRIAEKSCQCQKPCTLDRCIRANSQKLVGKKVYAWQLGYDQVDAAFKLCPSNRTHSDLFKRKLEGGNVRVWIQKVSCFIRSISERLILVKQASPEGYACFDFIIQISQRDLSAENVISGNFSRASRRRLVWCSAPNGEIKK